MRDPLVVRGDVIRWNDHSIDAETARDARASDSEASIKSINLVCPCLNCIKLHFLNGLMSWAMHEEFYIFYG